MISENDRLFMEEALLQARKAALCGEVPVGAVVTKHGQILAAAHNLRETCQDPTAHAEILAIREASRKLGSWRLDECSVYVTLEPCAMCSGAMILARVERCVYGASDPKGGFMGTVADISALPALNHAIQVVGGVGAQESASMLAGFFQALRSRKS